MLAWSTLNKKAYLAKKNFLRKKYLISNLKDKEPAMQPVMQQKYNASYKSKSYEFSISHIIRSKKKCN